MRLAVLDSGHGWGTKALFALIRTVSRQPVPEILKLLRYRRDFFGALMQQVTHEANPRPAPGGAAGARDGTPSARRRRRAIDDRGRARNRTLGNRARRRRW